MHQDLSMTISLVSIKIQPYSILSKRFIHEFNNAGYFVDNYLSSGNIECVFFIFSVMNDSLQQKMQGSFIL